MSNLRPRGRVRAPFTRFQTFPARTDGVNVSDSTRTVDYSPDQGTTRQARISCFINNISHCWLLHVSWQTSCGREARFWSKVARIVLYCISQLNSIAAVALPGGESVCFSLWQRYQDTIFCISYAGWGARAVKNRLHCFRLASQYSNLVPPLGLLLAMPLD